MADVTLRVLRALRVRLFAVFHAPSRDIVTTHLGDALLLSFALVTLATLLALMVL